MPRNRQPYGVDRGRESRGRLGGKDGIRVLHPDPPLGADRALVLDRSPASAVSPAGWNQYPAHARRARRIAARRYGDLLPRDALKEQTIGISVSDSPDLSRLGFTETHIRLAVGEIARAVFVAGGRLAYGGHLEPKGFTAFLMRELDRYGRNDRPLLVMLALQEHRKVPLSQLGALKKGLGLKAEIVCLDRDGQVMRPAQGRGEDIVVIPEGDERRIALTSLRREMVRRTNARS